jgi:hypothetical protein
MTRRSSSRWFETVSGRASRARRAVGLVASFGLIAAFPAVAGVAGVVASASPAAAATTESAWTQIVGWDPVHQAWNAYSYVPGWNSAPTDDPFPLPPLPNATQTIPGNGEWNVMATQPGTTNLYYYNFGDGHLHVIDLLTGVDNSLCVLNLGGTQNWNVELHFDDQGRLWAAYVANFAGTGSHIVQVDTTTCAQTPLTPTPPTGDLTVSGNGDAYVFDPIGNITQAGGVILQSSASGTVSVYLNDGTSWVNQGAISGISALPDKDPVDVSYDETNKLLTVWTGSTGFGLSGIFRDLFSVGDPSNPASYVLTHNLESGNFAGTFGGTPGVPFAADAAIAPQAAVLTVNKVATSLNGAPYALGDVVHPGDVVVWTITLTNQSALFEGDDLLTETAGDHQAYTGTGEGWSGTCAAVGTTCTQEVMVAPSSTASVTFTTTVSADLPNTVNEVTNTVASSIGVGRGPGTTATATVPTVFTQVPLIGSWAVAGGSAALVGLLVTVTAVLRRRRLGLEI